jgi:hypothetical protein
MANFEITVNNVPNDTEIIVPLHKITGQSLSLVKENLSKGLPIFSKDIPFDSYAEDDGIIKQLLDFFEENNIDVTIDYANKKETIDEFYNHRLKELSQESKKVLQEIYMLYLEKEGYVPNIDKDGFVNFKYPELDEEDEHCIGYKYTELDEETVGAFARLPYDGVCSIEIDTDDGTFVRLIYIGFWGALNTLGEKRLEERLYKAASETNAEMKLTKTFVIDKHLVFVTIGMMETPDQYDFDRMLDALRETIVMFEEKMKNTGKNKIVRIGLKAQGA